MKFISADDTRIFAVSVKQLARAYSAAVEADTNMVDAMWMNITADCQRAQLADAKAAQAMVVDRAAEALDHMADAIDSLIDEIEIFRGMKQSPSRKLMDMAHAVRDRLFRRAGHIPGNARIETAHLRALADADGLAMVQELRAERDAATSKRNDSERVLAGMTLELDRLAAEKAELEARVEKLVGALEDIAKQKTTDEIAATEDIGMCDFEGGYDAIIGVARAALSSLTPTPPDTDGPIWHERLGWDGNKEGEG